MKHAKEVAQAAVASIQSMQTAKNGPASSGAEEVPGKSSPPVTAASKQGTISPQADEQAAKVLAQEKVINTQAAQNAMLMQKMAEMEEKMAALQPQSTPTILLPPIVLDAPEVPSEPAAQQACLELWQSLRLLAQQETPVPVAWADLTRAHLPWADFLRLIPIKVAAAALEGVPIGILRAPDPNLEVPRRLLELLRTQLDSIVSQLTAEQKAVKDMTQRTAECNAWAVTVIDQAKRIAERKRPAAVPAESVKDAMNAPPPEDKIGEGEVL